MPAQVTVDLHRLRRPRRAQLVPIGLVAYGAAYLLWLFGPMGASRDRAVIGAFAIVPMLVLGAMLATAAAMDRRSDHATRRGWAWLAAALSSYCVGTTLSALAIATATQPSYPSAIDYTLLLFYPFAFLGLLAFAQSPRAVVDRLRLLLDVLIWVVGGGLVVWFVVIGSVQGSLQSDPAVVLTTVAYPVGDLLVLCGLATTTLGRRTGGDHLPVNLLLLGMGTLFLHDVAWAYASGHGTHAPGNPIDTIWMLAAMLLVLAADRQLQHHIGVAAAEQRHSFGISLLPYGFLAAGFLALLIRTSGRDGSDTGELAVGAAALGLLVIARQFVASREQNRFLEQEAQRRGDARFRSLVQQASDVILVVDQGGKVQYASPSVTAVLGYPVDAVVGQSLAMLTDAVGQDVREALERGCARPAAGKRSTPFRHADGHELKMDCVASDLRADPAIGGFVLDLRDASERHAFEEQLLHQAFHDSLTGLANRILFHERVKHALARRSRHPAHVAILYLDLDDFKKVNDSLGHVAGDDLLVEVSARLQRAMRETDTVARLGGDEFGVLVEDLAQVADVELCAERLLGALGDPIMVGGRSIQLGASIGVATADGRTTSVDELLRGADLAMYQAKISGKARFAVFDPAMAEAAADRLQLESDLRGALERSELSLDYQPVLDMSDGRIVAFEALLRWRHPDGRSVPPRAFIPIAEETGLIVPIGRWVMFEACRQLARWREVPGGSGLVMSINVSAHQLEAPDLLGDIETALRSHALRASDLIVEVTESVMVKEVGTAIDALTRIRATGVRISIDDFGSGYSTLAYLQRLPADILKIDKAFIDTLDDDGGVNPLAAAVIQIGHALGMTIIAEGVELQSQYDRLRELGCDYVQGFLLGEPIGPDAVMNGLGAHFSARSAVRASLPERALTPIGPIA